MTTEKVLGTRFLKASLIYLGIGAVFGAVMTIQPIYEFVVLSSLFQRAHAHMGLIGWICMAMIGLTYLSLDRLGKKIYSEKLGNVGFWLLNIGITIEFIVLMLGGYTEANKYVAGDINAETSTVPFTMFVMIFAFVMAIGLLMSVYNLYKTLDSNVSNII